MNYNTLEKKYLTLQKEKILSLARELFLNWELSDKQVIENYFNLFIKKQWIK
jgi:hypothetical protein